MEPWEIDILLTKLHLLKRVLDNVVRDLLATRVKLEEYKRKVAELKQQLQTFKCGDPLQFKLDL